MYINSANIISDQHITSNNLKQYHFLDSYHENAGQF